MISIDQDLSDCLFLAARIGLAMVFLVSGAHKAVWYGKAVIEFEMARAPMIGISLPATIALHLVASICLILGIFVVEAAMALAIFTLVATIRVHNFWNMAGTQRLLHSRIALTNLGLIGGLLLLAAAGPGPIVLVSVVS